MPPRGTINNENGSGDVATRHSPLAIFKSVSTYATAGGEVSAVATQRSAQAASASPSGDAGGWP